MWTLQGQVVYLKAGRGVEVNKIIGLTGKLEIPLINSAIGATPERVYSLGCPPKHSSDGMSYEDKDKDVLTLGDLYCVQARLNPKVQVVCVTAPKFMAERNKTYQIQQCCCSSTSF